MKRIWYLCEDRKQENFVRKFCEVCGAKVVRGQIAPRAQNAASGWVLANYAQTVRAFRIAASSQKDLGLIFVIDGDNVGLQTRKKSLADRLEQGAAGKNLDPIASKECIARFVPTWSIETWLLFLIDAPGLSEDVDYRYDPRVSQEWVSKETAERFRTFLKDQSAAASHLVSLEDARVEALRLGFK